MAGVEWLQRSIGGQFFLLNVQRHQVFYGVAARKKLKKKKNWPFNILIESIHYFSHKKHGKLISRRTGRTFFPFRTQRLWFTSEFLSVCNVKKNCKKDVLLWLNSNAAPPWSEMKREQWCINQDQSRELEKLHFTCVSASFVLAFPYRELGTHPGLFFCAELFVWKIRP